MIATLNVLPPPQLTFDGFRRRRRVGEQDGHSGGPGAKHRSDCDPTSARPGGVVPSPVMIPAGQNTQTFTMTTSQVKITRGRRSRRFTDCCSDGVDSVTPQPVPVLVAGYRARIMSQAGVRRAR